jgi:hypothetical protein
MFVLAGRENGLSWSRKSPHRQRQIDVKGADDYYAPASDAARQGTSAEPVMSAEGAITFGGD